MTDEDQAVYKKLEEEIEKRFGGKSGLWRSNLRTLDDESRIKAKINLIEQKIEDHKKQIEDLEYEKKGLQQQLEDRGFNEEDDSVGDEYSTGDKEYWDQTVELIFPREGPKEARSLNKRYQNWFDGRYDAFTKKFEEIPVEDFKMLLLEQAEERGYGDKVDELRDSIL